jgi:transketolase
MRNTFVQTLTEIAEQDPRVWLLCGDLGYSVLEGFAARFPDRYVNVGVAEQNMTGVAAGLAMAGKIVFTYSIANFPLIRCLEQIRNDVCYHNLPVKVVSVGGGLSYGSAGYSHHGVEDLAMARVLPHMTVVAPGDPVETRLATRALAADPGPGYLRLGKAGEPIVHATEPEFRLGAAIRVREGADATLLSTGGMLQSVVRAADRLAERGIHAGVLSLPTVQPIDGDAVEAAARATPLLVTVEEHGPGGLGSAVAEVLADRGCAARLRMMHLPRGAQPAAGTQESLRAMAGLDVDDIVRTVAG